MPDYLPEPVFSYIIADYSLPWTGMAIATGGRDNAEVVYILHEFCYVCKTINYLL